MDYLDSVLFLSNFVDYHGSNHEPDVEYDRDYSRSALRAHLYNDINGKRKFISKEHIHPPDQGQRG